MKKAFGKLFVGRTCKDALSAPLKLFLQYDILHMIFSLSLDHLEAQIRASLRQGLPLMNRMNGGLKSTP